MVVSGLAGWYGVLKGIQIYNTAKSLYIELKNAYEQTKANRAAAQTGVLAAA